MGHSSKIAMITGITGQDGGYLAKLLLEKGYKVIACHRRSATSSFSQLYEHGIFEAITLVDFDLLEFTNVARCIQQWQPDEFYNLAAQSFVGTSFEQPCYTMQTNAIGVIYILEALRTFSPHTKFYQASTSEMFGLIQETPQCETTSFYPRSPYGVSKVAAHWATVNYRESYGLHASSGILFNHESPMRGPEFVTRKITLNLARLVAGIDKPIMLGNLEARRDWGFAGDFVEAMWRMVQQEESDTYVIATGKNYSVRDFIHIACGICGYDLVWTGSGVSEKGFDQKTGKLIIQVDPRFYRPAEVDILIGDARKAREKLCWHPLVDFETLVSMMMERDLERVGSACTL